MAPLIAVQAGSASAAVAAKIGDILSQGLVQHVPLPAAPWLNPASRPNLKAALNYIRNVYAPQMQRYAAQAALYQQNMLSGQPLVPAPAYKTQGMRGNSFVLAIWDEAQGFTAPQEDWEMVLEGGSTMPFPPAAIKLDMDDPAVSAASMKLRLMTGKTSLPAGGYPVVSGAGYTSGGRRGGKSNALQQLLAAMPGCQCPLCIPPSGGPGWAGWGSSPLQAAAPSGLAQPTPGQPCLTCRYVTCRCSRPGGPPRFSSKGMPGFDGGGRVPELVMPDVMGSAQGYRWWTLAAPDLSKNPATADETWPFSPLKGMRDVWGDGENVARCLNGQRLHDDADIPHPDCSCGFWAYWTLQVHEVGYGQLPVCGVVEGYGAVEIGVRGFRAARAKIVALHLPFTIQPAGEPDEDPLGLGLPSPQAMARSQAQPNGPAYRPGFGGTVYNRGNPWHNHPLFHGKVYDYRDREDPPPPPLPELSRPDAAERQSNRDRAEAWLAVIGDRLSVMYPSAIVFETKAAMEAVYPPNLSYTQDGGTGDT